MNRSQPLNLEVASLAQAFIENTSSSQQLVLHTRHIQPSRLRLYGADGAELPARDQRERMKFDTRTSRGSYQPLAPGAKHTLFQPQVKERYGAYELVWGPFSFAGLAPGAYAATIEWASERNDYTDDSGALQTLPDVWLGTIRSSRFNVTIP